MPTVAFISFRLKVRDGVSREAEKRIRIFRSWGFRIYRIAGLIPEPSEYDHIVPALNDRDPEIEDFTNALFNGGESRQLASELERLAGDLATRVEPLLDELDPDLLVCENVFSLPLNAPLTVMLGRYIESRDKPCIAVHHELIWNRSGFSDCALGRRLESNFPAAIPQVWHVATSETSREQIRSRTGLPAACWHNCFDFGNVHGRDAFNRSLRQDLGVGADSVMILQPTEAIKLSHFEKCLSFAEDFHSASGRGTTMIITGEPDGSHVVFLDDLTDDSVVEIKHLPGWVGARRNDSTASSPYDMNDLYARSDLVTYTGGTEGFGNPVLESVVHRKPLLVADCPVLDELRSYGFQFMSLDGSAVDRMLKLLDHPQLLDEMLDRNFEIGNRHFSLDVLRRRMEKLLVTVPALSF